MSMLIAPEESDAVISARKGFGRVREFSNANASASHRAAAACRKMQRPSATRWNSTSPSLARNRSKLCNKPVCAFARRQWTKRQRSFGAWPRNKAGAFAIRRFNRDPDGRELANVLLRVPMKNYASLMQSLNSLGKVENVSVQRQDRTDAQIDEAERARLTSRSRFTARATSFRTRVVCSPRSDARWRKAPAPSCGACG